MNKTTHSFKQAGVTLVELCVTLAIAAILAGLALPSMKRMTERQQLQTLAQSVMSDLQQARSEAVQRGTHVQFSISQPAGGACYIIHTGKKGDCSCETGGVPVCKGAAQVLKSEWIAQSRKLAIRSKVAEMLFDARQGTVSPAASIDVIGSNGETIRHIVSITGRVRSCAPNGALHGLSGCATKG